MNELPEKLREYLDRVNHIIAPSLIEKGFKQTHINTREGLSAVIRTFCTEVQDVKYIYDDYIMTEGYNVPCRIYANDISTNAQVLVHVHGGGHVCGGITDYDTISRKLANFTGMIVVTPEYRLAPEFAYPIGVIDVYRTLKNVYDMLDNRAIKYSKILNIIGDSAGGANCSWVADRAQYDDAISINKQVLIYPCVDYTMRSHSCVNDTELFFLGKSKIRWYHDRYFQNGEDRYEVSPLFKPITPSYPETQIFVAGKDPLHDEGVALGDKLKKHNIPVEINDIPNMVHAYMLLENLCLEACNYTYRKISEFLKGEAS